MAENEWEVFLSSHADLEMIPSGKCRCKVTGHEMCPVKSIAEVRGEKMI
jgi:hypothetical protein